MTLDTRMSNVPSSHHARKTWIVFLVVVALALIAAVLWKRYHVPASSGLSEKEKSAIISQIGADSTVVEISDKQKASILKDIQKSSTQTGTASGTPTYTDQQKAEILQQIGSGSAVQ